MEIHTIFHAHYAYRDYFGKTIDNVFIVVIRSLESTRYGKVDGKCTCDKKLSVVDFSWINIYDIIDAPTCIDCPLNKMDYWYRNFYRVIWIFYIVL